MQLPNSLIPYAVLLPLLAAAAVHTFVKKPKAPPYAPLGWALLCLLQTGVCVVLTLLSSREPWIYIFNEMKFIGQTCAPVLMLFFYMAFLRIRPTFFEKAVLMAIPVLTIFFVMTNPMHHFFRRSYSVMYDGGFAYFNSDNGFWMYVYLIYVYITTLAGLALLIRYASRRSSVYREQVTVMTLGIVLAMGTSVAVMFFGLPDYADISVISLGFGGLISYMGCMLYSPKNMLNLARDLAIKSLDAPFILFNDLYELFDYNRCAAALLGLTEDMIDNLKLDDFVRDYLCLTGGGIDGREVVLASETLEEVYCRVYARYFDDKNGKPSGCVILLENITQGKRMIKELNFTLQRDRLTGMPNLLAFEKEFEELAKKECQSIILLYFNINGMKLINNAFGRAHGDEVIKTAASFIMSASPDRRLCARVSGDEFTVLLTDCRESDANELAVSVNLRLKNAKHLRLPVSVSYGATSRMWDAEPLERMLRRAGDEIFKQKMLYAGGDGASVLEALGAALDCAGAETLEHIRRTRETAVKFGAFLQLDPLLIAGLDTLAVIHDVGMLTASSGLINKPDPFTPEEWEAMKLHSAKGYQIALASPALAPAAKGVLSHHECWDGTGYPAGLTGRNIPLISRIIAITDSYDHWANDLGGSNPGAAKQKLLKGAGRQFDPELTDIFVKEFIQ